MAGGHALLTAPDPRTAWGWIAVCLLFPLAGPVLYMLFGINRVRTRGRQLGFLHLRGGAVGIDNESDIRNRDKVPAILQANLSLVRTSDVITQLPLLGGHHVEMLRDGESAYPRMIEAIDRASHSVAMATYLFDTDRAGKDFIEALIRAHKRGVEVRVLIDGVGEWYSFPRAGWLLRRGGVPVARFHPPRLLPPALYLNLRTHRKLLLVDGCVAFTGGMNIGGRHLAQDPGNRHPVSDLHFELRGPAISQLARAFAQDWQFSAHETWMPDVWQADAAVPGTTIARVITDGPNEDMDHLSLVMQAAIASARHDIYIMTPYFLPPRELEAALHGAALRGVRVHLILPERGNLRFVHYAVRHVLASMLRRGFLVWYQPAPFAHSKLFVADGSYALVGSANLDARSLRLNFELGVELFDAQLAGEFVDYCKTVMTRSRVATVEELERRPFPKRLRDAACWLFSPYL